jgi:hypothetical protein
MQIGVWLFATHLYARFAVVLLIPLALLAGRAVFDGLPERRWRAVAGLLVVGSIWNFLHAARLCREEAAHTVPAFWFYTGTLPDYEHYGVVNNDLPEESKVLLVGDARGFYYQRRVDYTVVFNESPFAEAIRTAEVPSGVVQWLRDRRYTHVLVHWGEVERLRATYGFSPLVTPELFDRLCASGLERVRVMHRPGTGAPYAELLAVPQKPSPTDRTPERRKDTG